jgi:3-oxoacid CoA-transferase subunit A
VAEGGLPWRYSPDGSVAVSSPPKEVRTFDGRWNGRRYVLEEAVTADFALVHASTGDTEGNLVFNKSARNFNPAVAAASRICIAQVENLVPAGELDPACVHLPGIFVDRMRARDHRERCACRDRSPTPLGPDRYRSSGEHRTPPYHRLFE